MTYPYRHIILIILNAKVPILYIFFLPHLPLCFAIIAFSTAINYNNNNTCICQIRYIWCESTVYYHPGDNISPSGRTFQAHSFDNGERADADRSHNFRSPFFFLSSLFTFQLNSLDRFYPRRPSVHKPWSRVASPPPPGKRLYIYRAY